MSNLEQKNKANDLRKAGNFKEALVLYRNLWKESGDMYDGAGLLHCLRKLELFDEAILLADDLIVKFPDFNWCRNEVIWVNIQGLLDKLSEEEPLGKVIEIVNKIMSYHPTDLALKKIIYKVLKSAKSANKWDVVNEWVNKISPDSLSTNPMTDKLGREGWSDQSLWYNYRINGILEKGDPKEAIKLVDEIIERFPKQRKFFLRLKAIAYRLLDNLPESEIIYQNLCSGYKPDWWMIHEYAKVVRDLSRKEEALLLLIQAVNCCPKIDLSVSLLVDIGMLYKELGKYEEARIHFVLCKYVRIENRWSIPESLINDINEINIIIGNDNIPGSLKEAFNICKGGWDKLLVKENDENNLTQINRKVRNDLVGKVIISQSDRPFCFISTKDNQSFFCYKSDLPVEVKDKDLVIFDAVPSFDKKKNKESWKASNIRRPE